MTPRPSTELDLFDRASLFTITLRRWGNHRKASMSSIDIDAEKGRMRLTKRLVETKAYTAIQRFENETKAWCTNRSLPAFIKEGVYVVSLKMVPSFERYLKEANETLEDVLIPALIKEYPNAIEQARAALGSFFDPRDYPSSSQLAKMFAIEWGWITFGVPDNLPAAVRNQEMQKLRQKFIEAQDEMVTALREAFAELLARGVERLKVAPGEKPKIFRDSLLDNFNEFLGTFDARNLMDDADLAKLVADCRRIVGNIDIQKVREDSSMRASVNRSFEQLKTKVDALVAERPTRKFAMDDEDEAA